MRVEIHNFEDRRGQPGEALAKASVRLVEPGRERALPRVWLLDHDGQLSIGFGSAAARPPTRGPGPPVSDDEIERIRTALADRLGLAGDDPVAEFGNMLAEAEADNIMSA